MSRKRNSEPRRTCIGCREIRDQRDLVRLALVRDRLALRAEWDVHRKLGGRGAWICRDKSDCLARAIKKSSLGRAFRVTGRVEPPQ